MREGWNTYKLGSFCDFQGGSQPPKGEWIKSPKEGYVRMLQIRDFTKSRDFDIEYVRITDKLRLCKKDDILIGRYGASVGKILTGLAGAYNVAIIKTIPDESIVCKPFLRRVLEAPGFQELLGKVSTQRTAQAGFSKEDIADYEVNLPSLPEQRRIVDILDREFAKIDALKANAEKSLQAAKDLFQATLKKELELKEGWITKTLKEIAEDIGDGLHGTPEYEDNGPCYFINGNNLNDGTIVFSEKTKRVSNEERIKYYIPLNEQTLLVSINGTLGKVAYYRGENIILGKSACYIVLRSGISREYVFHYLASDIFMQYAEKEYTGLTIKNVSLKSMRNFPICFPTSITDQKKIVDVLNILKKRCDTIKQNYQKTLTLCDDLKQSLLRKAFSGEL